MVDPEQQIERLEREIAERKIDVQESLCMNMGIDLAELRRLQGFYAGLSFAEAAIKKICFTESEEEDLD